MKKAVLFDLDNTLYDYDKPNKLALMAAHKLLKTVLTISYERFYKLYNISRLEIKRELSGTASAHNRVLYFQRLIEKTHNTVKPSLILRLYERYWDTMYANMEPGKDTIDILRYVRAKGMGVAIISDHTASIQLRKVMKLKISRYVDVMVTSEEAGSDKPHAIMFLLALNKLGVGPHEAMMVGDNSVADVEGANFVGMETVLVCKGRQARLFREDYRKPTYRIKELRELAKILER